MYNFFQKHLLGEWERDRDSLMGTENVAYDKQFQVVQSNGRLAELMKHTSKQDLIHMSITSDP